MCYALWLILLKKNAACNTLNLFSKGTYLSKLSWTSKALGACLAMEVLGQQVASYLTFLVDAKLFFKVALTYTCQE